MCVKFTEYIIIYVQCINIGGVDENSVTSFGYMEYLTKGYEICRTVVDLNLLQFLNPLLENAKHFGVENATDLKYLVHVIYYMCYLELQRRMNPRLESINYKKGEVGIIELECPQHILDFFGEHIGIAHWLYGTMLTYPYNNHESRNWYLTKLLRVDKWTVLFAINEAEMIPNAVLCPAFALAIRIAPNGQKEAVLSVRGTSSTKDKAIDIQVDNADFEYHAGNASGNVVVGKVHSGFLQCARAILDDYGIRLALERLAIEGYCIKVVGHSLGGGTAALIAAELKNGFMKSLNQGNLSSLPRIVVFAYAIPCCASAELSYAMAADELVYSLVNRDDPFPRLNRATAMRFFDEAKTFAPKATEWSLADYEDCSAYCTGLGRNPADIKKARSKEIPSVTKFIYAEPNKETKLDMSNSESKQNWIGIPLVVPGVVVCMYMDPSGTLRATLGDHRMAALQSLSYFSKIAFSHHSLTSYLDSLRCLRILRHLPVACTLHSDHGHSDHGHSDHGHSDHGHSDHGHSDHGNSDHGHSDHGNSDHGHSNHHHSDGEHGDKKEFHKEHNHDEHDHHAHSGGAPAPKKQRPEVEDEDTTLELIDVKKCSVCECNPTWLYTLKGDSMRAFVSHTCAICRRICCSMCAPASDIIPGQGFNSDEAIDVDTRISLPSKGLLSPQRVCQPCYFSCYTA
jgi:hypothetical protein